MSTITCWTLVEEVVIGFVEKIFLCLSGTWMKSIPENLTIQKTRNHHRHWGLSGQHRGCVFGRSGCRWIPAVADNDVLRGYRLIRTASIRILVNEAARVSIFPVLNLTFVFFARVERDPHHLLFCFSVHRTKRLRGTQQCSLVGDSYSVSSSGVVGTGRIQCMVPFHGSLMKCPTGSIELKLSESLLPDCTVDEWGETHEAGAQDYKGKPLCTSPQWTGQENSLTLSAVQAQGVTNWLQLQIQTVDFS